MTTPRFVDVTELHLPARGSVGRKSTDIETADLDGDGYRDLVVAQEFADFDGDGVLDLYVAYLAGPKNEPNGFDRLFLGTKARD